MDHSASLLGVPPDFAQDYHGSNCFGTPGKISRGFVRSPLTVTQRPRSPPPSSSNDSYVSPKSWQTGISPIKAPSSPRKPSKKKSPPAVAGSITGDLNVHPDDKLEECVFPTSGVSSHSRTSLSNSVVMSIPERFHHVDDVKSAKPRHIFTRRPAGQPESRSRCSTMGSLYQRTKPLAIMSMVPTETSPFRPSSSSGSPSTFRIFGRGGTGSQPRSKLPTKLPVTQTQPEKKTPFVHRPAGRGGAGSRPRPLSNSVSMEGPLHQRNQGQPTRTEVWAGKQKAFQEDRPYEHSLSMDWYCDSRNSSSSTVSSIYFAPISGVDPSLQSDHNSTTRACSPTPSLFGDSSLSHTDLEEDSDSPPPDRRNRSFSKLARMLGSLPPHAAQEPLTRETHTQTGSQGIPQRSLDKIARTLGDLPPMYDTLLREPHVGSANFSKHFIKDIEPTLYHSSSSSSSRRSSLSMRAAFFKRIGRRQDSASSHRTVSTPTSSIRHLDDVHADISGSWGEVDTTSVGTTPRSPFVFRRPSLPFIPAAATTTRVSSQLSLEDTLAEEDHDQVSFAGSASPFSSENSDWHTPPTTPNSPLTPAPTHTHTVSDTVPGPAVDQGSILAPVHMSSHSRSYSQPRNHRRSSRFSARTRSASTSLTLDTFSEVTSLPAPKWLFPPSSSEEDEMIFSATGPEPDHDNPQPWTGEWNRSDVQDVIQSLRTLR